MDFLGTVRCYSILNEKYMQSNIKGKMCLVFGLCVILKRVNDWSNGGEAGGRRKQRVYFL